MLLMYNEAESERLTGWSFVTPEEALAEVLIAKELWLEKKNCYHTSGVIQSSNEVEQINARVSRRLRSKG